MDEEKSNEENTELQNDSENTEIVDEKENSVNNGKVKEEALNNGPEQPKEPVIETKKENKEIPVVPKSKEGKEGSWTPMIVIMGISLVIAFAWDKLDVIRNSVHAVLDPSAGALLNWDLVMGMLLIVLVINLVTMIIQKYATDQEALKELKKEQKILQEEMKKYRDHPEKVAELSRKQMEFIPKTMKLTSRAIMYTGVPFILFFKWFSDYFLNFPDFKFFGFLSWFWFYLIFTMVFSMILRKMFKVV